jgi:hypothetical protein
VRSLASNCRRVAVRRAIVIARITHRCRVATAGSWRCRSCRSARVGSPANRCALLPTSGCCETGHG